MKDVMFAGMGMMYMLSVIVIAQSRLLRYHRNNP